MDFKHAYCTFLVKIAFFTLFVKYSNFNPFRNIKTIELITIEHRSNLPVTETISTLKDKGY